MTSVFSGLARAVAARSAAVPRGLARPALAAHTPALVAGVRFLQDAPEVFRYPHGELERRRRTLILSNVPWELSDEEVQLKVEGLAGFESIEPIEGQKGKFNVMFSDSNRMHRARFGLRTKFWNGRNIIAFAEHTHKAAPAPNKMLHLKGIPPSATDEALSELFAGLPGKPKISVPKSQRWEGYIGYAKISFDTIEQATEGRDVLREKKLGENDVFCDYSYPMLPGSRFGKPEANESEEGSGLRNRGRGNGRREHPVGQSGEEVADGGR